RALALGALDRPRPQPGRGDDQPLLRQGRQVDLALAAALHADDHQPAAGGERGEVLGEVLRADDVENDVDAAAVGGLADAIDEVLRAVVDADLGAQVAAGGDLLRRTGRGDRAGTVGHRELDGERADAARPA